jgi:hypothetical protein
LDPGDSVQELTIVHSGAASMEFAVAASVEYIRMVVGGSTGRFLSKGAWTYGDGSAGLQIGARYNNHAVLQATTATERLNTPINPIWLMSCGVWRNIIGISNDAVLAANAGAAALRYADDYYAVLCDDVSLTVTPASEANSLETSGLRVDGQDLCSLTPAAGRLVATQGWLRWNWTPRHDAADLAGFAGAANLPYIVYVFGDANNNIIVEVTAANTIQLDVTANAVNAVANWNCAAAIVAGTTYLMEVRWNGNWFRFIVDGVVVAQVNPAGTFALDPTIVYWGCDAAPIHEADATYAAP